MDEQTKIFIENILPAESEVEQALRIYAEKNRVPILRSDAAAFMRGYQVKAGEVLERV